MMQLTANIEEARSAVEQARAGIAQAQANLVVLSKFLV